MLHRCIVCAECTGLHSKAANQAQPAAAGSCHNFSPCPLLHPHPRDTPILSCPLRCWLYANAINLSTHTHTRTSFAASIAFTLSVYSNTSSISALCSPVPPPQMRQHTHASSCHPPSPCPQTSEREMARKELAAGDDHSALAAASEEVRVHAAQWIQGYREQ